MQILVMVDSHRHRRTIHMESTTPSSGPVSTVHLLDFIWIQQCRMRVAATQQPPEGTTVFARDELQLRVQQPWRCRCKRVLERPSGVVAGNGIRKTRTGSTI